MSRPQRVRLIKREAVPLCGSYEVRVDGLRSRCFYFEDDSSRRLRPDKMTSEQALELAGSLARSGHDRVIRSRRQ